MQDAFKPAPGTKFIAGTEEASRAFAGDLERIRRALAAAQDGSMLKDVAGDIRALTQCASGQLPAHALTAMISALNDELTRRVIALACAQLPPVAFDWCWIALGSEGRQEQTFASDQDNGIVFADGDDPEAQRALLLPLARRINLMLAECGFALCRGNIMASNPQCCLSLQGVARAFPGLDRRGRSAGAAQCQHLLRLSRLARCARTGAVAGRLAGGECRRQSALPFPDEQERPASRAAAWLAARLCGLKKRRARRHHRP